MSLQNAWYAACESRTLKRSPLAVTLFGKALVLWRDDAGQAQAFADQCPHRSAPLSAGKVKAGCLVCPYHGWEFHADGSCVKIPSLSGNAAVPAVARAKSFSVIEQQGYLWIWPGSGEAQGQPFSFPHLDEPGWMTFRLNTSLSSPSGMAVSLP